MNCMEWSSNFPLGNITWKHADVTWKLVRDQKHICNLLHIYGLCKIKCICNLRYIFNHSWKWHEYVCLSLYIKNGLGLGNHTFRPTRIIRISLKTLILGSNPTSGQTGSWKNETGNVPLKDMECVIKSDPKGNRFYPVWEIQPTKALW